MCKEDPFTALKFAAIFSTILSLLIGITIFSMGCIRFHYFSQIAEVVGIKYEFISLSLAILGLFIVLISFFGFVILVFTELKILNLFFHLMVAAFILQMVLGGYSIIHEQISSCQIQQNIQRSFFNYVWNSASRDAMNSIESSLHCCGLTSYTDYVVKYEDTLTNHRVNNTLPASCCFKEDEQCNAYGENHFTNGCAGKLYKDVLNFLHHFGILISLSSTISILSAMTVYIHGQAIGETYY